LRGGRFLQLRIERGAVVKYKAVAMVMGTANFFKILEDAAFELIDALITDILHMDRRFFAADAAGTERDHGFVIELVFMVGNDLGKFGEFIDAIVNGVVEGADVDFKRIAGIDQTTGLPLSSCP
jgi:large-conductance mechanosensitive channel